MLSGNEVLIITTPTIRPPSRAYLAMAAFWACPFSTQCGLPRWSGQAFQLFPERLHGYAHPAESRSPSLACCAQQHPPEQPRRPAAADRDCKDLITIGAIDVLNSAFLPESIQRVMVTVGAGFI